MSDPDDPKKEPIKDSSVRSCLIILTGWIVVLVIVASIVAVVVFKPGVKDRVSQGPDEQGAVEAFQLAFGFIPPQSVSKIYYGDYRKRRAPVFLVRFTYADEKLVDDIILKLGLEAKGKEASIGFSPESLVWWPTDRPLLIDPVKHTGENHYYRASQTENIDIWVDRYEKVLYYRKMMTD